LLPEFKGQLPDHIIRDAQDGNSEAASPRGNPASLPGTKLDSSSITTARGQSDAIAVVSGAARSLS